MSLVGCCEFAPGANELIWLKRYGNREGVRSIWAICWRWDRRETLLPSISQDEKEATVRLLSQKKKAQKLFVEKQGQPSTTTPQEFSAISNWHLQNMGGGVIKEAADTPGGGAGQGVRARRFSCLHITDKTREKKGSPGGNEPETDEKTRK